MLSFKTVVKPDDQKDYKKMKTSKLYKSYSKFIDQCKYDCHEEKLFVIFMLCKKKQQLLGKYKATLSDVETQGKLPDNWVGVNDMSVKKKLLEIRTSLVMERKAKQIVQERFK